VEAVEGDRILPEILVELVFRPVIIKRCIIGHGLVWRHQMLLLESGKCVGGDVSIVVGGTHLRAKILKVRLHFLDSTIGIRRQCRHFIEDHSFCRRFWCEIFINLLKCYTQAM